MSHYYNYDGLKTVGTHGALVNGEVKNGIPDQSIYVNSQSDLASLTDVPVGTFAIQYGFSHIWQLNASGSWVEV